jgi:hypothetical protein
MLASKLLKMTFSSTLCCRQVFRTPSTKPPPRLNAGRYSTGVSRVVKRGLLLAFIPPNLEMGYHPLPPPLLPGCIYMGSRPPSNQHRTAQLHPECLSSSKASPKNTCKYSCSGTQSCRTGSKFFCWYVRRRRWIGLVVQHRRWLEEAGRPSAFTLAWGHSWDTRPVSPQHYHVSQGV